MASLNIIYYSATGNTEEMAKNIAQGAKDAGADVKVINVEEADENSINADFLAFGSNVLFRYYHNITTFLLKFYCSQSRYLSTPKPLFLLF